MANPDLFSRLTHFLADLGNELTTRLGTNDQRAILMARAGKLPSSGAVQVDAAAGNALASLRDRSQAEGASPLELLRELADAMVSVTSLIQQVGAVGPGEDVWNAFATYLDLIAVERFRRDHLELVALLRAAHLLSDDRLLIADLFRAGDQWGSFLLGNPVDHEAKADNWSLLVGAALALASVWVPQEDDEGKAWRVDLLFGWDPDPGSPAPQAERALQRMATIRFTHRSGSPVLEQQVTLGVAVVPPADGGWGMFFSFGPGAGISFPIGEHLQLKLEANVPGGLQTFFGSPSFVSGGVGAANAKLTLRRKPELSEGLTIGAGGRTHLEVGTFALGFEFGSPMRFKLAIGDGALVIPKHEFGFMGSLMPASGVKFTFDVELTVDTKGKLSFAGGAGLAVTLPVNRSLAFLRVDSITLAGALEDGSQGASATVSVAAAFGLSFGAAFQLNVDSMGAKLAWALPSSPQRADGRTPVQHGNLGPVGDLGIAFVPPRGIGVRIEAGPIKGGGFFYFDPDHHTYAGVLEASLALCGKGIQIKAAGLLREQADQWDFLLILSAQFDPAIELFLGLTLNGVGGMLGINVSIAVDKLHTALHDGGVGKLLFPEDPVANAPAIIATMSSVFPHRDGGVVAGPMLQLGYGRPTPWITLSVAVVVALPSPALLVILGRLRVAVPSPIFALVSINADFAGVIDFEQPSFSFDASLVDSTVSNFTLTGDMAMRAGPAGFLLSIGGCNRRFPPPANMPTLRRLAIDVSANPITKIRAEAYLAVSSNSFQIGLHAQLDIDAAVASIHGWLDFDALVQWEPRFFFSVHMDVGLELRVGGQSLAGVTVDLLLEGPGPWHTKGRASISFLFFTLHAGFEVTWGEEDHTSLPPRVDASAQVAIALKASGAWAALAPEGDSSFTFRAVTREGVVVHPNGRLSVRQQVVPLGIPITRIGQSRVVGDTTTVNVTPAQGSPVSRPSMGQFASAQFSDLTDDQKLSRPSFESYQDGIVFGASTHVVAPNVQVTSASYETVFIPELAPRRVSRFSSTFLMLGVEHGAVARSGLHFATLHDGVSQAVKVTPPAYRVVTADTLQAQSAAVFDSAAAAFATARTLSGQRVLVVGLHETAP